jgi:hypothetical protein
MIIDTENPNEIMRNVGLGLRAKRKLSYFDFCDNADEFEGI